MSHLHGPRKSHLTPARRRLVELLQRLNWGRLEGLRLVQGQPVFDPAPVVVRERKLGADDGPRPEAAHRDFFLKEEIVHLFEAFDEIGDGVVAVIVVKGGLPFKVEHAARLVA